MDDKNKLSWSALEYEERERSKYWFWALGIIVVTSSIAAMIFGDYFFAALLILSGILLGFFAIKKPDMVDYELSGRGLKIRNRLYLYENIKAFWVQLEEPRIHPRQIETNWKPLLFIHTERIFMPVVVIPIDEMMAEDIRAIFLEQNIEEKEMKEHPSEKIMEILGF